MSKTVTINTSKGPVTGTGATTAQAFDAAIKQVKPGAVVKSGTVK